MGGPLALKWSSINTVLLKSLMAQFEVHFPAGTWSAVDLGIGVKSCKHGNENSFLIIAQKPDMNLNGRLPTQPGSR